MINPNQAKSGVINAQILQLIAQTIKPGINGLELEKIVNNQIRLSNAKPAFFNFQNYNYSSCISVNEVLVHGLPNSKPFKAGDVVSFDLGINYNGWLTDAAFTLAIPPVSKKIKMLISATKQALKNGIKQAIKGKRVGDISYAIEQTANAYNLGIIKNLSGHGISRSLHEPPTIPNFGHPGSGPILKEGMTIAIEPMFSLNPDSLKSNSVSVKVISDGWSIALKKDNIGAHFEHTITITQTEPIILTAPVDTDKFVW